MYSTSARLSTLRAFQARPNSPPALCRREYPLEVKMGQKPLTTAQIVDEICDFVANQQAVFLGGHYILQGSRNR
ncbi:hypothetical protein AWP89_15950 [Escherichia coli]|nr:hypothetical protein AWP89_15950 [Escherichia coli]